MTPDERLAGIRIARTKLDRAELDLEALIREALQSGEVSGAACAEAAGMARMTFHDRYENSEFLGIYKRGAA